MPTKPQAHKPQRPPGRVHQLAPSAPHAPVERWGGGRGGRPWRRLRDRILLRDQYTCCECGRVGREHELEVDHITPECDGGTDEQSNLQTLCRWPCHQRKTAREAARRRARRPARSRPA